MNQLAVERIKLLSTPSPLLCIGLMVSMMLGGAVLSSMSAEEPLDVSIAGTGSRLAVMLMLVLGALAVTTEYRFGTIRTSFQAVPNRTKLLLAKTVVVMLIALVAGELAAFGSWGVGLLTGPAGSDLALTGASEWRQVAGVGLYYMVGAMYGVAVGILLRHTAGAVALLLLWSLIIEGMLMMLPSIGDQVGDWLPFMVGNYFLISDPEVLAKVSIEWLRPLGPWAALGYFALVGCVLLAGALVVANRRDA